MEPSAILNQIRRLPIDEQKELLDLLEQYEIIEKRERCKKDFLEFVKAVWPQFIEGNHHKVMSAQFNKIGYGTLRRQIICMPPRHTKSEFASILLPAWFLGRYPNKKVIQTSHTAELAVGFGRRVRNIVNSPAYREIFPDVTLSMDSKAAGRWSTNQGGEYFAIGVGGAVAGKGADLFIIDDPHSEQEAAIAEHNPDIYDKVYHWYTSGPRQRLQPGARIVVVATRWSRRDLIGQLLDRMIKRESADEWELIEFPAIMPSGRPVWPEFWPIEELLATKSSMPLSKWNAQYQQDPTSEESALIKRAWWKKWPSSKPPKCHAVLTSLDTAYTKSERADYTACTTWGVFDVEQEDGEKRRALILLDAWRDKLEFPELKKAMLKYIQRMEPDMVIIEKKAAGAPLIYELRAMGIPVGEYTPTRGTRTQSNDKLARVNSVTDTFSSGMVYAPDTEWAEEVIDECAAFPAGQHDDYVDTVVQALLRFRQGGMIEMPTDYNDPDDTDEVEVERDYY